MTEIKEKPLALYVHIPFCVKKCDYCDFLSAPASEREKENYVNLLCREMEREAACYPDYRATTVFFGGGTPTVLRPEQLEKILYKLKEAFFVNPFGKTGKRQREFTTVQEREIVTTVQKGIAAGEVTRSAEMEGEKEAGSGRKAEPEDAEITVECNPGTVTEDDLRKLREAGFNRLSIGLQSAQNAELKRLGRIHTWEDFLKTWEFARKAGFRNINVDLMSALPGQSIESYVNSLKQITALHPEHISAYSLIIEEGTPFYERYGAADAQRKADGADRRHLLPTEEEERRMYELTQEILEKNGYHRYEISNYALPGYACRHNITYWKRGDYLGFGLGAASLMENCRFVKPDNLRDYRKLLQKDLKETESQEDQVDLKNKADRKDQRDQKEEAATEKHQKIIITTEEKKETSDRTLHQDFQELTRQEQMEEFMFLGLRLTAGISQREFQECFQTPIENIYGNELKKLKEEGLLICSEDRIYLTKRGIDVSNMVLAEFLL